MYENRRYLLRRAILRRERQKMHRGKRRENAFEGRLKGDARGNRRHARAKNDRSILISTSPRRVLPLIRFSNGVNFLVSYLRLPLFVCADAFLEDARTVIVAWNKIPAGTRFYPFSLSLYLSFSLIPLLYWFVYAKKYLPFSDNTPRPPFTPPPPLPVEASEGARGS